MSITMSFERTRSTARQAARALAARPGFTATIVLALGLGIGANTAVFTVVDHVLLEPLPYPDAERLVYIWARTTDGDRQSLSGPEWADLTAEIDLFESVVGIFGGATTRLEIGDGYRPVINRSVSSTYFDVFGVRPLIGQSFVPEDDFKLPMEVIRDTSAQWPRGAAVITYELWQGAFGGDPAVLGRPVDLGGRSKEIVGVMPPGFQGLLPADLDEPHVDIWEMQPFDQAAFPRDTRFVRVLTRVRPGATLDAVQAALDAFSERQRTQHAEEARAEFEAWAAPLQPEVTARARQPLILLLATVAFVMLIASVNVATLMLARGEERASDFGLRRALGASGRDLIALAVAESLLAAGIGVAFAMVIAWPLAAALMRMVPAATLTGLTARPDGSVLLLTSAVGLLVAIGTAVVPGLRAAAAPVPGIGSGMRASAGRSHRMTASALVAFQVALALVLATSTGLLLRSLTHILAVDPGFEPAALRTAKVNLGRTDYPTWDARVAFFRNATERIAAVPGVTAAGILDPLPFEGSHSTVAQLPGTGRERGIAVDYRKTTPGVIEALGLEVVQGRSLNWGDLADFDRLHAVVDDRFAREAFADGNAVGRTIGIDRREYGTGTDVWDDTKWVEIVGVVPSMRGRDLRWEDRPTVWVTYSQNMYGTPSLLVRTDGRFSVGSVRRAVADVDPALMVFDERWLESLVTDRFSNVRFALTLVGLFGVLGIVLAVTGVYGLLSYTVGQRRGELHVRAALGAGRGQLRRLVLRQGIGIIGAGTLLGWAGAWGSTRLISFLLYGVTPTDPGTFAGMAVLLGLATTGACLGPAARARGRIPQMRCDWREGPAGARVEAGSWMSGSRVCADAGPMRAVGGVRGVAVRTTALRVPSRYSKSRLLGSSLLDDRDATVKDWGRHATDAATAVGDDRVERVR